VYNSAYTPWHTDEQNRFKEWLIANNRDPADPKLSLGYLHLGQVDLLRSFGTQDPTTIWESMSQHLDIYKIEVDGVSATYDYCWTDVDYKEQQIAMMKPGYDYQARTQK
jgi:hypothetical protein